MINRGHQHGPVLGGSCLSRSLGSPPTPPKFSSNGGNHEKPDYELRRQVGGPGRGLGLGQGSLRKREEATKEEGSQRRAGAGVSGLMCPGLLAPSLFSDLIAGGSLPSMPPPRPRSLGPRRGLSLWGPHSLPRPRGQFGGHFRQARAWTSPPTPPRRGPRTQSAPALLIPAKNAAGA